MTARAVLVALAAALAAAPASAGEGDRGAPPPPGPPPPIRLPVVDSWVSPTGMGVLLVTDHDLPIVRSALVFRDAARAEEAPYRGLAGVTTRMLLWGGTDPVLGMEVDYDWLQSHTEGLGVLYSEAYAGFGFSCFPEDLVDAWDNLSWLAADPALPEDAVEMLTGHLGDSVRRGRADASRVGAERVRKVVLAGHRERIDAYGNEDTLGRITPDRVTWFHDRWFNPQQALLMVVGDIERDDLELVLSQTLDARWEPGDGELTELPSRDLPVPGEPRVILMHKPAQTQAQVFVAAVAPHAASRDLAAVTTLAEIVGGGIDSRLNRVLREERGDSYGLGAFHEVLPNAGVFWTAGAVDADRTVPSIQQMLEVLDEMGRVTVPQEELDSATAVLEGRVMRGASTTAGLLAQMLGQLARDGDPARLVTRINALRRVTVEDVRRVAAEWLAPERRTILVVGDAEVIGDGLEQLGPPVEVKYRPRDQPQE